MSTTKQVQKQKQELQQMTKQEFLNFVKKTQRRGEISWLTTDKYSFEWHEINSDKKQFLKDLSRLKFKKAHVGVFYRESKDTEYISFKIK